MSHANSIDFNIGSENNVKWNFFGLIKYLKKKPVNEMEQEEQENEYINAFDI